MSSDNTEAGPSVISQTPQFPENIVKLTDLSCPSTESAISCRICKFAGGSDLMSSPCNCKGSMGLVHVSCLEEWLTGSSRDSCELCSETFNVTRFPKYSCFQSIWIFFWNKISILRFVRDLIFLAVSIINTCILLCLWLTFTFREIFNVFGRNQSDNSATTPLRTIYYFFFFTVCLMFVSMNAVDDCRRMFYYYFLAWYYWWQSTIEVRLIVDTDDEGHLKNQ